MLRRRRKSENCKSRSGFAGVGKKSKIFVRSRSQAVPHCSALRWKLCKLSCTVHNLVAGARNWTKKQNIRDCCKHYNSDTLQVVLHKLVAGVTRLLSFHTCTFYDQSHHISRTLTAISEEHIPKALLIERSNDRLQWVTNEKKRLCTQILLREPRYEINLFQFCLPLLLLCIHTKG